jgi:GNAT superfamily N-acetyltransferase
MPGTLTIASVPLPSTDAAILTAGLDKELAARYPGIPPRPFSLTNAQISSGNGIFLVAKLGLESVGCGALQRIDTNTGEIRCMYVKPSARGHGVGHCLLDELEGYARKGGLGLLILATGIRQPEAIQLYERCGFTRTSHPVGAIRTRVSVYMAKALL